MNLDIESKDKALYIKDIDTLVMSDLHLGRKKPDTPYPEMEHKEIEERVYELIDSYNPSNIVFNGDTFNQRLSGADYYNKVMFSNFNDLVTNIIFVKGNHDEVNSGLPEIMSNKYSIKDKHEIKNFVFYHGHKNVRSNADVQVLGHLHPCYNGNPVLLYNPQGYKNKKTILLPAFSNIVNCVERSSLAEREFGSISISDLNEYRILYRYD